MFFIENGITPKSAQNKYLTATNGTLSNNQLKTKAADLKNLININSKGKETMVCKRTLPIIN